MVTGVKLATDRATRIRAVLAAVADPEIPAVSVLDLGIVREIDRDGRSVAITPTYSGCPATAAIETNIRAALAAACPRCGSPATEEVSRFGSTPCKALWRCLACAEPFDRFKCH